MLKTFIKTALSFGILMFFFAWLFSGRTEAAAAGIIGGLGFGLMMTAFAAYQKNKFRQNPPVLGEGEKIIKEGAANYIIKGEGVGGWLYLTDRRLLFRSHKFNFNNHETEIPLGAIKRAAPSAALIIIPTAIKITLAGEREEKFVVEGRKDWCSKINISAENYKEPESTDG